LQGLLWEGLESVFLGHLSETNNRPELALTSANQVLDSQNICLPQLIVGQQNAPQTWVA
jgi:hypothetical protein